MLNLNITTIIIQIVNFIIFAIVLYFLLFKNVIKRANLRKQKIEELQSEIERNYSESQNIKNSIEKEMALLEQKFEKLHVEEKEHLAEERKKFLEATNLKAKQMVNKARKDAEKAKQKAFAEYNDQFIDAIVEICRLTLAKVTPDEVHQTFVQQLNERIWELGKKEMQRVDQIRRSLQDRDPIAQVDSAKPISPELQTQLVRTLSALADRNVRMEVHIETSLGSGVRIRLGDLIIENSISATLEELRKSMSDKLIQYTNSNIQDIEK